MSAADLIGGPAAPADMLIIGAGPAGLAAAEVALGHGRRVVLVDMQATPGGQLWRQGAHAPWPASRRRRFATLFDHPNLRWLAGHRLVLWLNPQRALFEGPQGAVQVDARQLLLAAGARELIPPFPGWTLPGVSGAGALQAMAKAGLQLDGERVSLVGSGPLLMASAATLAHSGARLTGIFEAQPSSRMRAVGTLLLRHPARLKEALSLRWRCARTPYAQGWRLLAAQGEESLQAVLLRAPDGKTTRVPCTRLGVGFGLIPSVEIAAGLNLAEYLDGSFPALSVDAQQCSSVPGIYAAGEVTGVGGGALAEIEGRIAGLAMVDDQKELARWQGKRAPLRGFAERLAQLFPRATELLPPIDPTVFLCRCEDVPWSAVGTPPGSD